MSFLAFLSFLGISSGSTTYPMTESFVSYQKEVRPIFSKKCSKCHSGTNKSVLPNLLVYENAYQLRFEIKTRIQAKTMPHVGRLTESESDLVIQWVDQGAKE